MTDRNCNTCTHHVQATTLDACPAQCWTCAPNHKLPNWKPIEIVKTTEAAPQARVVTDAKARKAIPIATGVLDYFPDALCAVAELSKKGNDQHNPGQPLHWARGKSTDHADCILRHLIDRGTLDTDGIRHSAKVAWRALAQLQVEIEQANGIFLDELPK